MHTAGSRRIRILVLVLTVFSVFTGSVVHGTEKKWWQREDEGWFFYRDPPDRKEESLSISLEAGREEKPPLATEELKKEGERLLSKALVEPSEENVRNYMAYQKEMIQKSERFAFLWQRLLLKYPDLYASVSTEGVNEEIRDAVSGLSEKAGLFFLYRSECSHCRRSAAVVAEFRNKYGFAVLPVSLDGPVLPELPETRADNGISTRLGIDEVPAWYLAYPGEDRFERIGCGFMTLPELERRLYHYAVTENTGRYIPAGHGD